MNYMSNFSERLKELIAERAITKEQLAEQIGASRSSVYRWTLQPMQINRANIIAIADYFECSIDFLIGRTENPSTVKPKQCPDFSSQLRKIMQEKGISTYSLRKTTKYDGSYFTRWKKSEPGLQQLIDLSQLFDCSIDYLVGREN